VQKPGVLFADQRQDDNQVKAEDIERVMFLPLTQNQADDGLTFLGHSLPLKEAVNPRLKWSWHCTKLSEALIDFKNRINDQRQIIPHRHRPKN
jgi:hypothetical protein